jgi:muramidase (phage lysozyme)
MSFEATGDRWQAAATSASSSTIADRWQIMTRQWLEARAEYRALYDAEITNVSALRKAAQRLHDLGQLRKVLAGGAD